MMADGGGLYKEGGVLWHWVVCHSSTTSINHSVIHSIKKDNINKVNTSSQAPPKPPHATPQPSNHPKSITPTHPTQQ
jgi:hypothetical protein